jgi:hypothetical protein
MHSSASSAHVTTAIVAATAVIAASSTAAVAAAVVIAGTVAAAANAAATAISQANRGKNIGSDKKITAHLNQALASAENDHQKALLKSRLESARLHAIKIAQHPFAFDSLQSAPLTDASAPKSPARRSLRRRSGLLQDDIRVLEEQQPAKRRRI